MFVSGLRLIYDSPESHQHIAIPKSENNNNNNKKTPNYSGH